MSTSVSTENASSDTVGGRIARFADFWIDHLKPNRWAREILLQGYKIPFTQWPKFQGRRSTPLIGQYSDVLLDEVDSLLGKRAIEHVSESDADAGFYSTYFLVPKKSGDLRPILNLKPINQFMSVPKFRMETLAKVITAVRPGDWMASIDLKDAYFHVPIHPEHRKYLRFCIQRQAYQYRVLPFGLSTAPRTFTKMLAPVMEYLRMRGVQLHPYLDDILLTARSQDQLSSHILQTTQALTAAGYVINLAKSSLAPSQDMIFIGARLLTAQNLVCTPVDRAQVLVAYATRFRPTQTRTARQWLRLLGLMAATLASTKHARLRMRPVQTHFHSLWHKSKGYNHLVPVNTEVHQHILWWQNLDNLLCGLPLSPAATTAVVTTDASSHGWGGVLGEEERGGSALTVQGKWDPLQMTWHINQQELMAVFLTVTHFAHHLKDQKVLVRSDNTTTCCYINKFGGTKSPELCQTALRLWEWCITHQIELIAVHVPGVDNVLADFLSRETIDQREWSLHQAIVNKLFYIWTRPNIDLFASIHNRKLEVFCSMTPSPAAFCKDALSISWSNFFLGYAFPPIALISRVLRKVCQDQARLILIAPLWPGQGWYPTLLRLLTETPRSLPISSDLLSQHRVLCPNPEWFRLVAWKISGVTSEPKAFQRDLSISCPQQGLNPLSAVTKVNGEYLNAGVVDGVLIPIRPL